MEKKLVDCPFDGVWYYSIPGLDRSKKPLVCPICGAKQIPGGGIHDGTLGTEDAWPHQKYERTILTDDEAIEIFKKYAKLVYPKSWIAGKELFENAWYYQHWSDDGYYKRRDWMGDDLILAFEWYLDCVGRYGKQIERRPGTKTNGEMLVIEQSLNKMVKDIEEKRREKQRQSQERAEIRNHEKGLEIVESLEIGDVALVKFKESGMPTRGMLVMEIEDDFIGGFYLDRETEVVHPDAEEEEGFIYSDPKKSYCWWNPLPYDDKNFKHSDSIRGKHKWDGKSFIKTREYHTKMVKFVKGKVENPVILK